MSTKQLQQQTTKNKRKAQIPIKQQACMHKTDSYSLPTRSLTEDDSTMLENKQTKQAAKISLVGIALKKKKSWDCLKIRKYSLLCPCSLSDLIL